MSKQFVDAAEQTPLNIRALSSWLADRGASLSQHAPVCQFRAGLANINYLIEVDGAPMVLRRPPGGKLPPGAHDMAREHRILSRLWAQFPLAPHGMWFCDDRDVIGVPFQINEYRDGQSVRGDSLGPLANVPNAGAQLSNMMVNTLCEIHAVDVEAVGLSELGRPAGFVPRAIAGWSKRAGVFSDEVSAIVERITPWLHKHAESLPDRAPTLLHSDFKLDNILLAPGSMDPVAVVDWDMGTLGDPLFDLATLLSYWAEADDPPCMHALAQMPTAAHGFDTRDNVVNRYAETTGCDMQGLHMLRILALFRLGVVFLQLHQRWESGAIGDNRYAGFAQLGQELLEFADQERYGHAM